MPDETGQGRRLSPRVELVLAVAGALVLTLALIVVTGGQWLLWGWLRSLI